MALHLLIDGNSLTYRAFFALPEDMVTSSGQVTNAVFGFASMLHNVLRDQRPDGVLVAFDRSEPTFRHEAEPTYKAQRAATPDNLRSQMPLVRSLLDALGVTQVDAAGWEADDLIATAARRLAAAGDDVIVVTGDRDSYQLVEDPHIKVLYNRRGVSDYALYDEAGIAERTGVPPRLYPDYAALRGDTSDNLPGVPGVGEKTAAKLIMAHGGLDGALAAADEQTPKLRANLHEHAERARRNLELMRLRDDAPIGDVSADTIVVRPDIATLRALCADLEFTTMGDRLLSVLDVSASPEIDNAVSDDVQITSVVGSVDDVVGALRGGMCGVAPAWSGEPGRSPLMGLAVVAGDGDSDVVAWWADVAMCGDDAVRAALGEAEVCALRAKELLRGLADLGVEHGGVLFDPVVAAYLVDPADARFGVDELMERFGSVRLARTGAAPEGQLDLDASAVSHGDIAARTAFAALHLHVPLREAVADAGATWLHDEVEVPLIAVLARMEHLGIAVDIEVLSEIGARLAAQVADLAAELREVSGRADLNVNSPVQLRALLYDERGLSPKGVRKTKTGYSTDAGTLEKLRDDWPEFIGPLLRYREVEKLRGTYGEGLLTEVADDGRIHATFNQTVARTGRLSSDHPNLHNIPVRSAEGRVFRTAFVPSSGNTLMVADYNQIELRCIAHLAGDPGLLEAFNTGVDIHAATASRVFGVAADDVSIDQRSKAKMVSYGLAYGMEAYGLGQRLGIPTDEAAVILDAYFEAFPAVREYMDRTVAEARERGYTETLFGRRRRIPELLDGNWRVRQAGERQAMNAGIQGLAADIFKIALVLIDRRLRDDGLASRIVLQVHDEVIVDVPASERDTVDTLVIDTMRSAVDLDVPLEVNVAWGASWAAAKG